MEASWIHTYLLTLGNYRGLSMLPFPVFCARSSSHLIWFHVLGNNTNKAIPYTNMLYQHISGTMTLSGLYRGPLVQLAYRCQHSLSVRLFLSCLHAPGIYSWNTVVQVR